MKHKQIIVGDYVFTPCKNAFNNKTSYWVSKKDHTISVYAFTPMDNRDLKDHISEKCLESYMRYFDSVVDRLSNK